MSSPLTTYLDLDRTLYRTNGAGAAKWCLVGQVHPQVNVAREFDRQRKFYQHNGDAYAYDFTAHLLSLDLDVAAVYAMLRRSELADGHLEYDGVADLVAWAQSQGAVKILTYGIDDYQRLKASLCPSLAGVEVITTLRPKGEYLRSEQNAWMVDDKPIGYTMPPGVRFIQACLEGQDCTDAPWPVAASLHQVLQLMIRDR